MEIVEIMLNNFELGSNFNKLQENSSKTFHGEVSDLKYTPRTVKHLSISVTKKAQNPSLVLFFMKYIACI